MVLNEHCVYHQNILHKFIIKNRRYVFMLPSLPLMTTIFLLILDFYNVLLLLLLVSLCLIQRCCTSLLEILQQIVVFGHI
jgi:hypothetical protein